MYPVQHASTYPAGMYGQPVQPHGGVRKRAYDAIILTSCMLAFFWLLVLCWPWGWIRAAGNLNFDGSLFSMQIELGGVAHLGAHVIGAARPQSGKHSIADQMRFFCQIDNTSVCTSMQYLFFASLGMAFWGFVAVAALLLGATCIWYYQFQHATETGRNLATICFVSASLSTFVGFIGYVALTFTFMSDDSLASQIVGTSSIPYGGCVAVAFFLMLMTPSPLLIQSVFVNASAFEKKHDSLDDDYTGGYGTAGYGGGGYGAAGYGGAGKGAAGYAAPAYGAAPYGAAGKGAAGYGAAAAGSAYTYGASSSVPAAYGQGAAHPPAQWGAVGAGYGQPSVLRASAPGYGQPGGAYGGQAW